MGSPPMGDERDPLELTRGIELATLSERSVNLRDVAGLML
jgi:hypothetical protein